MANAKIIEKKQSIVNEIAEKVNESSSVVLFEYDNMSVAEMTKLRRQLKENDAELKVYKNTLTKRAIDSLKLDLGDNLNGPKAIAFGKDEVTPVKILSEFAKKCPALEIKVGIIEGKPADLEVLKKYASIPSREVLLTQVASGLIGTVRNLAIALDMLAEQKGNN